MSKSHYFQIKLGLGSGTNMFAKLLSLWGLLLFAQKYLHLQQIKNFGDSLVVVRWFNKEGDLLNLTLEPWQQKIHQLQEAFEEVYISHVHREFNSDIDSLSKEALSILMGELRISEFLGSSCNSFVWFVF